VDGDEKAGGEGLTLGHSDRDGVEKESDNDGDEGEF